MNEEYIPPPFQLPMFAQSLWPAKIKALVDFGRQVAEAIHLVITGIASAIKGE